MFVPKANREYGLKCHMVSENETLGPSSWSETPGICRFVVIHEARVREGPLHELIRQITRACGDNPTIPQRKNHTTELFGGMGIASKSFSLP